MHYMKLYVSQLKIFIKNNTDMDNSDIKSFLEKRFHYGNIPKYYKYFEEWYNNLLPNQLDYFTAQMNGHNYLD